MRVHVVNGETYENGRRVAEILSDMKDEFVEFAQTRVSMLRAELLTARDKVKAAIPVAVAAVIFLSTAFLLLTGALVGLILAAFPHSIYRWFIACLIVGLLWGIVGALAAFAVVRTFKGRNMIPTRTLEVLKRDKLWIQSEVRNRA
jgi:uncharacterized membrane protein YqjE